MWESGITGTSLVQNIPISQFISALIGGGLALTGTIYSLRHQQTQRNKRLRRALVSEINCIEAGQLHFVASTFRTDEGGSNFLDDFVEDYYDELTDGLVSKLDEDILEDVLETEKLKKESMRKAGRMVTSINMSTPVWNSNTDKVGNLDTEEIEKIIRFYRLLGHCKHHTESAVDAAKRGSQPADDDTSASTESFEYHMSALQDSARGLAEKKKEALEALNGDEFIEIEDSYLLRTENEDDEEDGT